MKIGQTNMDGDSLPNVRKGGKDMDKRPEIEIAGEVYHKYQFSILRLCEMLHMYTNETMEGLSPKAMYVAYRYLKWRIEDGWTPQVDRYDTQLCVLVRIAIMEYKGKAQHEKLAEFEHVSQELVFHHLSEALIAQ
jgi:hypothetical protein